MGHGAGSEGRRECSRFKVPGSMDFKVLLLLRYRFLFWLYVDFFIYFLLRAKRSGRRENLILVCKVILLPRSGSILITTGEPKAKPVAGSTSCMSTPERVELIAAGRMTRSVKTVRRAKGKGERRREEAKRMFQVPCKKSVAGRRLPIAASR